MEQFGIPDPLKPSLKKSSLENGAEQLSAWLTSSGSLRYHEDY